MSASGWLRKTSGLDQAVLLTVGTRSWAALVGVVTIFFVARYLSPTAQGFYYTFASLIALQVFVELGLTYAIVQFASHEMAQLTWQPGGTVAGDELAKKRLRSLLTFALAWFGAAALATILLLLPLGFHLTGLQPGGDGAGADFHAAWTALVILAAVNLPVTAAISVLEGCGQVVPVARVRLVQSVAGAMAAWAVLAAGGALLALAAQAAVTLIVAGGWLFLARRAFFADLFHFQSALPGMDWRREIWPFHWRIAISWVSGYLIFQLFNPLLFTTHGPVAAGQMGLSLQVFAALGGIAMAWISTQLPTYGRMVAASQGQALDRLFFRGLFQSTLALLVSLAALLAGLWFLRGFGSDLPSRVLPPGLMLAMAGITLANHLIFAQAAILRAHKQDPFMALSVASGLVTAVLAFLLIPAHGLAGAVAAYGVATTLIGLVGGTAIFFHKRRTWWLRDAA